MARGSLPGKSLGYSGQPHAKYLCGEQYLYLKGEYVHGIWPEKGPVEPGYWKLLPAVCEVRYDPKDISCGCQ